MKKLILLFSILVFTACSEENSPASTYVPSINPPSWIIGTWAHENGSSAFFVFTKDDMFYYRTTSVHDELVKYAQYYGYNYDFQESKTDNIYYLRYNDYMIIDSRMSKNFKFEKISDQTIKNIGDDCPGTYTRL